VHVDVGLDEARQQRDVAQVVDIGRLGDVGRQRGPRPDGFDAAADHQDGGIGQPAVQRRFGHPGREEQSPVRHPVSCTGRSLAG
jgi:hypothetical protein